MKRRLFIIEYPGDQVLNVDVKAIGAANIYGRGTVDDVRCETCEHWGPRGYVDGECDALNFFVETPLDFGCIRWEAKT